MSMGTTPQPLGTFLVVLTCLSYLGSFESLAASIVPVLSHADDLVTWVRENGGQVGFRVGSVNADGLRGGLALRNFKKGEAVTAIPFGASINVGPAHYTAAELSVQLLRFSFENMERLKSWAPYFRNIPNKMELYSKYLFQRKHVPLLQDVQLEEFAMRVLDWTEAVYNGSASVTADRTLASLAHLPQAKMVQLEDFSHYAALLDSYSFGFPDETGQPRRWLLPLMDMLNHNSASNVNVIKDKESQSFVAVALRDIREGEEVTYRYSWGTDRNDKALLNYFFLHDRQPPLLCAVDLPSGYRTLLEDIEEPPDDSDHVPGGSLCTQDELLRLKQILVRFPTSEAEDRALLESKTLVDWREQMLVKFRVLRKEALRATIESLKEALGIPARELELHSGNPQRPSNRLTDTINEL